MKNHSGRRSARDRSEKTQIILGLDFPRNYSIDLNYIPATKQVPQFVLRIIGNQVQILSSPATVTGK